MIPILWPRLRFLSMKAESAQAMVEAVIGRQEAEAEVAKADGRTHQLRSEIKDGVKAGDGHSTMEVRFSRKFTGDVVFHVWVPMPPGCRSSGTGEMARIPNTIMSRQVSCAVLSLRSFHDRP